MIYTRTNNGILLKGDCLELMPKLTKQVDMILCDLPYGTTACKWDTIIPFEPLWEQYERLIKPSGAIVLTACQPFTSVVVMSNVKRYKHNWTWDKVKPNGHLVAKHRPMNRTEDVLVFCKNSPTYNPIMTPREKPKQSKEYKRTEIMGGKQTGSDKILNDKYPQNVLVFSNASQAGKFHPTQKPVALFEYLIKTYTNEGDTVLDNCMGSGTTAIACENTGRKWIGIEQEEEYCQVIKERLNERRV